MAKTNCNKCVNKTDNLHVSSCGNGGGCKTPEPITDAAKAKAVHFLKMHGTKAAKFTQTHFQ